MPLSAIDISCINYLAISKYGLLYSVLNQFQFSGNVQVDLLSQQHNNFFVAYTSKYFTLFFLILQREQVNLSTVISIIIA